MESGCRYGFRHLVRLIDGIKCRLPRKLRRRIVLERYFYDGADVIADYDLFGRFCKASYLTPFLDENLLVDRRFAWRTYRYWYTQDSLGSVRQLIDCSDRVRNSYAYTSWGEPLHWHESIPNRYTFTGREYNPESSLYHYRGREYVSFIGRFASRDPQDMRTYRYVDNRPAVFVDPFGRHMLCSIREKRVEQKPRQWWLPVIQVDVRVWLDCRWRRKGLGPAQIGRAAAKLLLTEAKGAWERYGINIHFDEMTDEEFAELIEEETDTVTRQDFVLRDKHASRLIRPSRMYILFVTKKQIRAVRVMPIGAIPVGKSKASRVAVVTGVMRDAVKHELWHVLSGSLKEWVWHPVTRNRPPSIEDMRIIWQHLIAAYLSGGDFIHFESNDFPLDLFIEAFKTDPHSDPRVKAIQEWIEREMEYWRRRVEESIG